MSIIKNLIGGVAGAVALNILHETLKRFDHDAPRVDLVGEEGVNKTIKAAGGQPLSGDKLYAAALSGDLISNALYYSTIGLGKKKHLLARGAALGLAAGLGAVTLPEKIGLSDAPVTKTPRTTGMTVAYYLFGGLVTALTIKALRK
ncbi:hypothetical protein LT679_01420 [Mucilaginibacter roseus]|uniref:Uncharacterized protein n=1 Tax=Mucilaginibacter roseus TaxID=1528868 RepID=A0ABS8U123_9SPHI|nr:hypothetical protein [Mucilaginibacter roseus]MCD8739246.1 hypothetical protein [Mucilaginibacter roseus]